MVLEKEELQRLLVEAEKKLENLIAQNQSPISNLARSIKNIDGDDG